ncbi:glycerol-3-phosphate responsive antiterminator [Alicyclobacillus acidocaldarius]|uniref:Glycerol uptake operon antiterminator regulatory protein n=1 Tax=Alicyclobacillus acidocaldarius (strain Tc-4-1) TaxID=1048834 RepID=F8IHS8_ALIAT|nr:glycerol-3-phosphate responsive antiterminator [Alicyclobacillus acidocaldarius]AEJ42045.1 glycerol-3-phosphate responsive antiterminator, GlpP [Alicyclobacillus acidocaldarius subsp. acidocaldarius Tc-4-1]
MNPFEGRRVLPAVRSPKDFEELMQGPHPVVVLLETNLTALPSLMRLANKAGKRLILHADLIQGLKHDEAGTQFLCQMIRPYGIISTHASVIATAKKQGVIAIQRVFLIDSHSLRTSYRVLQQAKPDYLEVLPGVVPQLIAEIREQTGLPVLAGGFVRTKEDVERAVAAGATAVTTSVKELWQM